MGPNVKRSVVSALAVVWAALLFSSCHNPPQPQIDAEARADLEANKDKVVVVIDSTTISHSRGIIPTGFIRDEIARQLPQIQKVLGIAFGNAPANPEMIEAVKGSFTSPDSKEKAIHYWSAAAPNQEFGGILIINDAFTDIRVLAHYVYPFDKSSPLRLGSSLPDIDQNGIPELLFWTLRIKNVGDKLRLHQNLAYIAEAQEAGLRGIGSFVVAEQRYSTKNGYSEMIPPMLEYDVDAIRGTQPRFIRRVFETGKIFKGPNYRDLVKLERVAPDAPNEAGFEKFKLLPAAAK